MTPMRSFRKTRLLKSSDIRGLLRRLPRAGLPKARKAFPSVCTDSVRTEALVQPSKLNITQNKMLDRPQEILDTKTRLTNHTKSVEKSPTPEKTAHLCILSLLKVSLFIYF